MVRVLGNSSERVPIKDLNDCIYYKQLKEYSDQEYASSSDLKRVINAGKIVLLEQVESPRGSTDTKGTLQVGSNSALSAGDLKSILKEMLPKNNGGISGNDVRDALRDMAPLIVDMVRQEVSKISVSGAPVSETKLTTEFQGPTYVPSIDISGMTSSIQAKETEHSSDGANEALEALRKMQGIQ